MPRARAREPRVPIAGLLAFALLCAAPRARAGGPLGPQGTELRTSNYSVDLFQGPVFATSRITALGGAYTAIAEGSEGIPFNPAAASLRAPYSTTRVDYDVSGGVTLPATVARNDFDNNGDRNFPTSSFVWATLGGYLQVGKLGFGAVVSGQNYALGRPGAAVPLPRPDGSMSDEVIEGLVVRLLRIDAVVSYGFLEGQLHVGGGLRTASFYAVGETQTVTNDPSTAALRVTSEQERLLLGTTSSGLQGGVLWAPYDLPFRLGGAARTPMLGGGADLGARIPADAAGDRIVGDVYLPRKVELPWEAEVGVAVQLWRRPLNLPWIDERRVPRADVERWRRTTDDPEEPHNRAARRMLKARYRELPREKVLLAASLLVSGAIDNAVGLEGMLARRVDRSGERVTYGARVGAEAEVVPYVLVLRAGSYVEPTRFRQSSYRAHATGGAQVRLGRWDVFGLFDEETVWRITGHADVARDYFAWGVGVGVFR